MKLRPVYVTKPSLPPLEDFLPYLKDIWETKQLTNNGKYLQELEEKLCSFLGVKYISLYCNGTIALMSALKALDINGEVITTPYSFVATSHVLWWNGIRPCFTDIRASDGNLDVDKIKQAISPATKAILPVHVYGNPCQVTEIEKIARDYTLFVIYDAAHAFHVKYNGQSVLNFGDLSVLSFHATKTFNTFEGGADVCHDKSMKVKLDYLRNFGFRNETMVIEPGINGKMNELQAAFGLLQLKYFEENLGKRRILHEKYLESLINIPGIQFIDYPSFVEPNYSYFPILVNHEYFGRSRDDLYNHLQSKGIYGRRYFFPLISSFSPYNALASADPENLPVATRWANEVICLPIFSDMDISIPFMIGDIIKKFKR